MTNRNRTTRDELWVSFTSLLTQYCDIRDAYCFKQHDLTIRDVTTARAGTEEASIWERCSARGWVSDRYPRYSSLQKIGAGQQGTGLSLITLPGVKDFGSRGICTSTWIIFLHTLGPPLLRPFSSALLAPFVFFRVFTTYQHSFCNMQPAASHACVGCLLSLLVHSLPDSPLLVLRARAAEFGFFGMGSG